MIIRIYIILSLQEHRIKTKIIFSSKYGQGHILKPIRNNNVLDSDTKTILETINISDTSFSDFKDSLVCDSNFVVNVYNTDYSPGNASVKTTSKCSISPSITTRYPAIDSFVKQLIGAGTISGAKVYENQNTGRPIILYNIRNYSYCRDGCRISSLGCDNLISLEKIWFE